MLVASKILHTDLFQVCDRFNLQIMLHIYCQYGSLLLEYGLIRSHITLSQKSESHQRSPSHMVPYRTYANDLGVKRPNLNTNSEGSFAQ